MTQIDTTATDPEVRGAERLFAAWLEGQMAYQGLPGIAVGVVSDQQLVWSRGFGLADLAARTPVTPSSQFRMASHSKLFTATAIMQLREQGKVRLDDPVTDYLPWFALKNSWERSPDRDPSDRDRPPPITLEQLLCHASGLPREAGDHWSSYRFPSAADVRSLIADRVAPFPPATRWKYSNLAYTIAGLVVEQVSGLDWAQYVQQHIFAPLRMLGSSVDRDVPGLVKGYGRRMPDGSREALPFVDARGMAAATGVTSNVDDMAKFVSAQFASGAATEPGILSAGSLREMHRVRSLENDWSSGSGIGFAVSRVRGRTYAGHGGAYPGYRTQTLLHVEDRVGVIVLTNSLDAEPETIARRLMSTVGEAVVKARSLQPPAPPQSAARSAAISPAISPAASPAWDPAWAQFAGIYRGAWNDVQVVLLHQRLVMITLNGNVRDDDPPVALEPLGGGRFRHVAPGGLGPVGEVVRFVEDGGRVTRLIVGDGHLERLPGDSLLDPGTSP